MNKKMTKKALWMCVAISLLASPVLAQQIGGGTLNGTVTDPSGAAITNAKVTATQTATFTVAPSTVELRPNT